MAVNPYFTVFDVSKLRRGLPIASDQLRDAWAGMAAVYEFILDRTVLGKGSQTFVGHDHADQGGAPIIRNAVCTVDGGAEPLWTMSFADASVFYPPDQGDSPAMFDPLLQGFVSPGIDTEAKGVHLELEIGYRWANTDPIWCQVHQATLANRNFYAGLRSSSGITELGETGGEVRRVVKFDVPCAGDFWNVWKVNFRRPQGTGGDLYIYSLGLWETYRASQPIERKALRGF